MPTDDELYEQVVTRGRRLRRRRRLVVGGSGVAAVVVVALVAVGLAGGSDDDGESVVADAPPSEASSTTSTTVAVATTAVLSSSPTMTVPPPSSTSTITIVSGDEPATTTAPPPVCRNSREPACGPFHWDPVPTNEPITFTVTSSPANPVVGQPVTVTVTAHDPEAEILATGQWGHGSCHPSWGDTDSPGGCLRTADGRIENPPRTGPWDLPPPVGATSTATFEHTYTAPGTYTVTVYALAVTSEALRNSQYDVYGEDADDTITITVGP